ncbi:hypothetical protein [Granulicella sibirica]|uniref:Uncharacterized protein n=1 Tax=Granulicella sibirica TaxID=2479048 RepID=A0A4Q0TA30_9BACT|nr:hypothetical protein [Granulicella sibirica]RXH58491.1 hypothetical protein GRAN_1801 [Granulicella sibirica]
MEKKRVAGRFVKDAVEERSGPEKKSAAVGAPRPRYCRSCTRKRMAEALPQIVEALVDKAKEGSVPHTQALAELSGLTRAEAVPPVRKRREKSLASALLEQFGE